MTVDMIISFSSAASAAEQDRRPFTSTDPTQPRLFFSTWPAQQQQAMPSLSCCITRRGSSSVYAARE